MTHSLGEVRCQQPLHGRNALQVLPLEELILAVEAGVLVKLVMGKVQLATQSRGATLISILGRSLHHLVRPQMRTGKSLRQGDSVPPAWSTRVPMLTNRNRDSEQEVEMHITSFQLGQVRPGISQGQLGEPHGMKLQPRALGVYGHFSELEQ